MNVHQNTRKHCLLLAWTTAQVKKPFIRESIDTETFGWKPLQNRPRCWFFYFLRGKRSELLDNGMPIPKTSKHLLICFLCHSLCVSVYVIYIWRNIQNKRKKNTRNYYIKQLPQTIKKKAAKCSKTQRKRKARRRSRLFSFRPGKRLSKSSTSVPLPSHNAHKHQQHTEFHVFLQTFNPMVAKIKTWPCQQTATQPADTKGGVAEFLWRAGCWKRCMLF